MMSMDKTVAVKGTSRLMCPEVSFPIVEADRLRFSASCPQNCLNVGYALPGRPLWMRDVEGHICSCPDAKRFVVPMCEIAVNPRLPLGEVDAKAKEWGVATLAEVREHLGETGRRKLVDEDKAMLGKCRWVCNIYRTLPVVLPADEPGGYMGVVAFQVLGMIGG